MFPISLVRGCLCLLVSISIALTVYLHLYPFFHGCAFPSPAPDASASAAAAVPFRLLALGDPQLEGDSSIPGALEPRLPHFYHFWDHALARRDQDHGWRHRVRYSLHHLIDFFFDDIPVLLELGRKRIDHFGNDWYLGHIYRCMHWWTRPTHVTVLGDLVGSQWIDDDEFDDRGRRFWNRVVRGGHRVEDHIAADPRVATIEPVPLESPSIRDWQTRIINVAGNHDIGYAGDLTQERMDRFHRVFGNPNYELRFQLPSRQSNAARETSPEDLPIPEIRIVVINDMNLDTPATSQALQDSTYAFLNSVITTSYPVERKGLFSLVLTHIPLHKPAGVCVDEPFFSFYDGEDGYGKGVKEQNHLSAAASGGFLEGLFGMSGNKDAPANGQGRHGMVLTGHDHEGCDVYHYIDRRVASNVEDANATEGESPAAASADSPKPTWQATTWQNATAQGLRGMPDVPGLHEVTVRSMMGDFGGNAGLLSVWFNETTWEWQSEFTNCALGTQHIWWFIYIFDLVTVILLALYLVLDLGMRFGRWDVNTWWDAHTTWKTSMHGDKSGHSQFPSTSEATSNRDPTAFSTTLTPIHPAASSSASSSSPTPLRASGLTSSTMPSTGTDGQPYLRRSPRASRVHSLGSFETGG